MIFCHFRHRKIAFSVNLISKTDYLTPFHFKNQVDTIIPALIKNFKLSLWLKIVTDM